MEKNVIQYDDLNGNRKERKEQFNKQLKQFEKDAQDGKLIDLTSLMINAESFIKEDLPQD